MISPSMNLRYEQSATPLTCPKNNLKPPSRKLWHIGNSKPENPGEKCSRRRQGEKENWDVIDSPQFVDFFNLPNIGDSFFSRGTLIASTPKSNFGIESSSSTVADDDTLIASLNKFSLSAIKHEPSEDPCSNFAQADTNEGKEYVVHDTIIKVPQFIKEEKFVKVKKPTTVVNPFSFDRREKYKQELKQEHKKVKVEEEKKRVFRANPVPKFVKCRLSPPFSNNNNKNNKIRGTVNSAKIPRINVSSPQEKHVKNNTEVWKKPPFIPSMSRKDFEKPKAPHLFTASRAQERKRYDDTLKEKEKRRNETRELELAAKKKQEEEEIARLRKLTVHRAQPVPKYKLKLPQIEKRPLTDPVTPLVYKRRRHA